MSSRRSVSLDPDAMAEGGLHVVVRAPTRVLYRHQYGGTACRGGRVEGYLVPLGAPVALAALRALFEGEFGGAGAWESRLREVVASIPYWLDDGSHALRLDDSRIREADEAWVPVLTPDGPGVLLWCNSD